MKYVILCLIALAVCIALGALVTALIGHSLKKRDRRLARPAAVLMTVVFALAMGLFADMSYIESTVGFTLLFPALAFGAGFVAQFFINRRFFGYMAASAGALLITSLMQMLWVLLGDRWDPSMLTTALLQTLWSLPLAALLYFPPARWID